MRAVPRKQVVKGVAEIGNAERKADQKAYDAAMREHLTHHLGASGNVFPVYNVCRSVHIKLVFGDYSTAFIGIHADKIKRFGVIDSFGKMHTDRTGGAAVVIDYFHALFHTAKVY